MENKTGRREFIKRILGGLIIFSSARGIGELEAQVDLMDIQENPALRYWADASGNHDGRLDPMEEGYTRMILTGADEFYVLTKSPDQNFAPPGRTNLGVHPKEREFRESHGNINYTSSSYCVLKCDLHGNVLEAYQGWGNVGRGEWERLDKVPVFDYKALIE